MKFKVITGLILALLFIGILTFVSNIQPVKASGTIYIKADGSIVPSTANITSIDNVTYTFTDNNYDELVVERDNIVVDGAGHTLQGTIFAVGMNLTERSNVTVRNMEIKGFGTGIYLYNSSNNIISGNNITNNGGGIVLQDSSNNIISGNNIANEYDGILLDFSSNNIISGNNIANHIFGHGILLDFSSNSNTIYRNKITNNSAGIFLFRGCLYNIISVNDISANYDGIGIDDDSCNNTVYHNNFVNNTGYTEASVNYWDDGYPSGGNYWSNYNGTDANGDGIGDTAYVMDSNNTDRYPLMHPWSPTETSVEVMGVDHPVTIVSNTTISQIHASENTFYFTSSGQLGEKGYVNVIFPMVNTTEIKVFIDGNKLTPPPFPVVNSNGTHYFIYFEFTLSNHTITIQFASPVGGIYIPVNKLSLLAPYIALASSIMLGIAVIAVLFKYRKKQ